MIAGLLFLIVLLGLIKIVVDMLEQPEPVPEPIPVRIEQHRRR